MLARLFDGLVHPFIHVGYGVEFRLKGMLVEGTWCDVMYRGDYSKLGFQGLAMVAVHDVGVRGSLPPSLFAPTSTNNVEDIANRLWSFALEAPAIANSPIASKAGGVHAFDIVARILKDNRCNRREPTDFIDAVREHAEKWTINLDQPGEVERKMEELVWLSSLVYAVGGSTPNGFQSDFFLCVTPPFGVPMRVNNVN